MHLLGFVDEEIPRLQVAVDHAPGVRVRHRVGSAPERPHALAQPREPARVQRLLQRFPAHVRHRIVRDPVLGSDFVHRDNAGMFERPGGAGFAQEPQHGLGLGLRAGQQCLERYFALELRVEREVYDPHAATAQLAEDFVLAESSPRFRRARGHKFDKGRPGRTILRGRILQRGLAKIQRKSLAGRRRRTEAVIDRTCIDGRFHRARHREQLQATQFRRLVLANQTEPKQKRRQALAGLVWTATAPSRVDLRRSQPAAVHDQSSGTVGGSTGHEDPPPIPREEDMIGRDPLPSPQQSRIATP